MPRLNRLERQVERHLAPGEQVLAVVLMSGSRDRIPSDIPADGVFAYVTSDRFVLMHWETGELYWWTRLVDIVSCTIDTRWQSGLTQKGRETIFDLQLRGGGHFRGIAINLGAGNRRLKRFGDVLRQSIR